MRPVITSLLDTDLYKFTMWQAMLHRHPETEAEYTFLCRNEPAYPLAELVPDLNRELDALCALSFKADELKELARGRGITLMSLDANEKMAAVGFGNAKAVEVIGKTRSGNEKTVRVAGKDLQKHIVHRARKGCLLPGRITPIQVKS